MQSSGATVPQVQGNISHVMNLNNFRPESGRSRTRGEGRMACRVYIRRRRDINVGMANDSSAEDGGNLHVGKKDARHIHNVLPRRLDDTPNMSVLCVRRGNYFRLCNHHLQPN